jgi:AbrB family looped-hinge helix DNA binding protein
MPPAVEEKMRYAAKITAKGQVTIPKAVREEMGLAEGDYLVFERGKDAMTIKRSAIPPTEDFEALAERISRRLKGRGVTREDVADAIRWARRKS